MDERRNLLTAWTHTLDFPSAAQPEIIRADQKDAYFINTLQERIEPLLMALKGSRWVHHHSNALQEISKLIYLATTTLPGSQTLGEEYCDIIQFDRSTNNVPTLYRRIILILAQVYSPRLVTKLQDFNRRLMTRLSDQYPSTPNQLQDRPSGSSSHQPWFESYKTAVCSSLLGCLRTVHDRSIFTSLNALHLSIFYLTGRYFTWSKRFTEIAYISNRLRPLRADGLGRTVPPSYEVLGVLMMIQLIVRTIQTHRQTNRRRQQLNLAASKPRFESESESDLQGSSTPNRPKVLIPSVDGRLIDEMVIEPEPDDQTTSNPKTLSENLQDQEEEEEPNELEDLPEGVLFHDSSAADQHSTSRRCTLCLGPHRHQTSLECGHLFCWKCVVSWVREKPECPLCRHAVRITDLLPLYNF